MTTDIIVFLGPTLGVTEAQKILPNALYLPPVQCGDVIKVLRLDPKIIAIIDGFFENTAAVWHKEILYALGKGVQVYGAASMGALRAAELSEFGMKGIGKIYEAYHQGVLTDDDEVCVVHRPAESNYEPITDAMVNIRASVERGEKDGLISQHDAAFILELTKATYYKERVLKNFAPTLPLIDQKKIDAMTLLCELAQLKKLRRKNLSVKVNPTLFLRTLCLDAMCQAFSQDNHGFPLGERLAIHAPQLGKEYRLIQYLAYFIAAFQAMLPALDYSNMDPNVLLKNPSLICTALIEQAKKELPFQQAEYLMAIGVLVDFNESDFKNIFGPNLLSLMMDIFHVLEWYIQKKGAVVKTEGLQFFVNEFRKKHQLLTKDATYAWMKEKVLTESLFEKLMVKLYHLEYFVMKNNFDQLGTFIGADTFWLAAALVQSGSYEKIKFDVD